MKILFSIIAAAGILSSGCATQDNGSQPKREANAAEKNPEVGMSKDQVTALYGPTNNQQVTSEGETWVYNLNMGEAFIPFNFGYHPKMRIIQFGKDGKVASWSYTK